MLCIVAIYDCLQFQGKLNLTWKTGKKPSFGTHDLGFFAPNVGPNFFFIFYIYWMLEIFEN